MTKPEGQLKERCRGITVVIILLITTLLGSCRPKAPAQQAVPTRAGPIATAAPLVDRVQVRWFTGLGTGSLDHQIAPQQKIVDSFNASQNEIELVLEVVNTEEAAGVLAAQMASGDPPDIVGPLGIMGRDQFKGAWLDLGPLVKAHPYDLSDYNPAMLEIQRVDGELLGLPFIEFPSFLYVNHDLFDAAGLAYPPQTFGELYEGEEWDLDALGALARQLTIDRSRKTKTAANPDFDPENIVQYGYSDQWATLRGAATLFGPGTLVDPSGNAHLPDHWRTAVNWYYQGIWEDHFIPNNDFIYGDLVDFSHLFQSGRVAMVYSHTWYSCCIRELEDAWDLAVVPAFNGVQTARVQVNTFHIMSASSHPEQAFEVLTYFLSPVASAMIDIYGGTPARLSLQEQHFENLTEEAFPGREINWQVAIDSASYPDSPQYETWMPNLVLAEERSNAFWKLLQSEPDLDIDAEIDRLEADLQALFEEAAK
jgi:multiple sugar transport system substrate-binding protein